MLGMLKSFHDELCGGHIKNKKNIYYILHYGYFLSSIYKDTGKYVRCCDKYHEMGQLVASN